MPTPLDRRRFLTRSAASAAALFAAREGLGQSTAAAAPGAAPPAPAPPTSPAAGIVRLGQNENPWGPSEAARRAATEAVSSGNRYV